MAEELDGAEIFENWDQLIQSPEGTAVSPMEELDMSGLIGQEEKGEAYWENLFRECNFGGMNLMPLNYYPYTLHEEDFFKAYMNARKVFIKNLGNEYLNDLRIAGISEEGIFYLTKGVLPANWVVHLKRPPLYGGRADPENMVLVQSQPFHELIHDFVNKQILTGAGIGHPKILYMPTPVGPIHVPKETG